MSTVRASTSQGRPQREVFEDLVRSHHVAVYRTALRVTQGDADARDVTQRVFLDVLEGKLDLARAEDPARVLRSWAARAALAHLRGARNARRREEQYAMRNVEGRVDRTVEKEEERRTLARLVGALPEDLRLPVELRFREQWTLGEIGAALELSEPSVHERLKRGLEVLRRELGKLGFSALAVHLEAELAHDASVAAPAGLAPKLLALHGTASGFAALPALAIGGAFMLLLGVVLWIAGLGAPDGEAALARSDETEHRANSDANAAPTGAPSDVRSGDPARAAAGARDPVATSPVESEPRPRAPELVTTIEGRVVDELGLGVGGARVLAAPPGKGFPANERRGQATTRPDGSFTVQVALEKTRETIQLAVDHADHLHAESAVLRVSAGETSRASELVLARASIDPPGEFTLVVRVVDPDGAPLPGAVVRLFRRGKSMFGGAGQEWEAGGATGADGQVELSGRHLGEKLVVLDAREKGWRLARERVTLAGSGRTEHVLRAERGGVLAGTVRALDGTPLAKRTLQARPAEDDGVSLIQGDTDAAGRFELVGLDPVLTRLTIYGGGHSDACLVLVPSRADLDIVLKLSTDPTDVGDHMAELHGVVVDARTRAPVAVAYDAIEVQPVRSTTRAEFLASEAAGLLVERPVQTFVDGNWQPPPPSSAFRQTGLPAGNFVLVARVPGFAPSFAGPFELGASTLRANVELALEAAVSVKGRVLDARGAPVRGALVVLAGGVDEEWLDERDREVQSTEGHPRYWYDAHATDGEGRFSALASPGIGARMVVFAHGHAANAEGRVTVGVADAEVELRLGAKR